MFKIEFEKANEFIAYILKDGMKVGTLEKRQGGYNIQVMYKDLWFIKDKDWNTKKAKALIRGYIGSLWFEIYSEQVLLLKGKEVKR